VSIIGGGDHDLVPHGNNIIGGGDHDLVPHVRTIPGGFSDLAVESLNENTMTFLLDAFTEAVNGDEE